MHWSFSAQPTYTGSCFVAQLLIDPSVYPRYEISLLILYKQWKKGLVSVEVQCLKFPVAHQASVMFSLCDLIGSTTVGNVYSCLVVMPTSTTTSDEGSYMSIILLRCCAGDSVVVWCVGWAVWDSFKNITAEFLAGLAPRIKTSAERLRDESEQRVLGWKLGRVNALKTSRDST